MREKFLNDGNFDGFAPHNILEMMLFYSTPRADTNELAHELISKFGSLKGVFDAPYESLLTVDGVGQHTAVLIKLIQSLVKVCSAEDTANIKHAKSTEDAVKYLRPYFAAIKNESMQMLCLNNSGKIIKHSVISNGSIDSTQADLRKIMFEILSCHATKVIIAHNHPGGICAPSDSDIETTKTIAECFKNLKISLVDHIIITEDEYYSFAEIPTTKQYLLTEQTNIYVATQDKQPEEDNFDRTD